VSQTYSFHILISNFFKKCFITIFFFTLRAPSLAFLSALKIKRLCAFSPVTPQNSLVNTAPLAGLSAAIAQSV
jgi:hypothetical protein